MPTPKRLILETFRSDANEQFYFHLKSRNGKLISASEGYPTRRARDKTVALISSASWVVRDRK